MHNTIIMDKTAIVIGATGMVGAQLIQLLLENEEYKLIKIFSRRSIELTNPKIKEYIVDFDNLKSFVDKINGDVLFSTMGTTIRAAGSKEAQYKVDYTYQFEVAKAAAENGVNSYVLVSSAGANARSKFFYMRMKGKLDESVKMLPFKNISIIRPASLVGERAEKRAGEKLAIHVTNAMVKIIPGIKKYRPIHSREVAEAMINVAEMRNKDNYKIFAYDDVFKLAKL